MIDIFINILGVICLTASGIYIWSFLLKRKINFKDYKFYVFTFILIILSFFNYNTLLKFTILTLFMSLFVKIVFKVNYISSFVTIFCTQTLNVILEILFSVVAIFILGVDVDFSNLNFLVVLAVDIFISIGCILTVRLKFFQSIHKMLIKVLTNLNKKIFLLALIPIIFVFNVYLELTYYKISFLPVFILNNISTFIIVIIILILVKKENEYIKIYDKYNTTLNSLKEYEDILDKYKISNHENKNQLLTIRNMIADKNKKAIKYIDEIVKNKLKDDEIIMQEVSIIPAGGLRGLVYSKILDMKQKKIEYELNISKDVRTVDLINKLDDSDMLDICQVVGVYIDNAIQAVENSEEKYINIELYLDNDLVFEISNYYEGIIELDKLDEKGYTTKGKGHGYGLSLTKKIIDNNKKLKNERKLSKNIFTQVLIVKMK